MSEEQTTPSVPPPPPSSIPSLELVEDQVKEPTNVKKTPKFMSVSDLPDIINILSRADQISPDEAVRRLNNMVAKGTLVIVPTIGTKRKA